MSRRRPFTLLPPKAGKRVRRSWGAIFRPEAGTRIQRTAKGIATRAAAREWAVALIRQDWPQLCHLLDLNPPRHSPSPRLRGEGRGEGQFTPPPAQDSANADRRLI
jgi:hypothetical protein